MHILDAIWIMAEPVCISKGAKGEGKKKSNKTIVCNIK